MEPLCTFETLPDEILIIIFRYSGDVYSIFHAYSGLNQRFNNILTDRRSQILNRFLNIKDNEVYLNDYYRSSLFQNLLRSLSLIREDDRDVRLRPLLESLVVYHIHERYRQHEQEFLLKRQIFNSIRSTCSSEDIHHRDEALKRCFQKLNVSSEALECLNELETFIVDTGACLQSDDHELSKFNLAHAINRHMLSYSSLVQNDNYPFYVRFMKMVKMLIISNPNLVNNRDYVGNGGYPIYFFLIHILYRLQDFYSCSPGQVISTRKFQVVLDFLLFILQCMKHLYPNDSWVIHCFSSILYSSKSTENEISRQIIITISQTEIFKIILDELSQLSISADQLEFYSVIKGFNCLVKNHRLDMITVLFHHEDFMRKLFEQPNSLRDITNTITGDRHERRLFRQILDSQSLPSWFISTNLFFILLAKKECGLIKKLLHLEPTLINSLDTDGNNPLLYLSLKVNGCRHRLIEFFISIGCDTKRPNVHGVDFIQSIQLKRNRHLLKKLIDYEIIVMKNETELLPKVFITIHDE